MDYVPYAVPFFLLLIVVELAYGWLRGRNSYRLADGVNSVSLGTISISIKLVTLDIGGTVFSAVNNTVPWQMPADAVWTLVFAFVFYDLCYYWFHRISHERQIFWASHVAHHQSEEYNLTTALRQTGTGFLTTWVFYLPCFLIGMPVEVFISVASINLIYQFWVHTVHVPRLGILEWVLVTPSNHRVHHAQNSRYMDRNYGGVFIVWDRLFGSFEDECDDDPPIFGITRPLHSWNPFWANVHVYWQMLRDSVSARSWRETLYVWVARNGWRPQGAEQAYPLPRSQIDAFCKFQPKFTRSSAAYAVFQFLLIVAAAQWVDWHREVLAQVLLLSFFVLLVWTLVDVGRALEGRPIRVAEMLRLLTVCLIALLAQLPALVTLILWCYIGLSVLLLLVVERRSLQLRAA